jgi:hypothetical protein
MGDAPQQATGEAPAAGAAASFVYRAFSAAQLPAMPSAAQRAALKAEFPDALLMVMPKSGHGLVRDFKWLGSHRYGILHLGGRDAADLRQRCERASALLGWRAPYAHAASAAAGSTSTTFDFSGAITP